MSQMREPTIRLRVDPANPGQYFACCGLLELADRLWDGAEGWFEDGMFAIWTRGTMRELLTALLKEPPTEITRFGTGLSVKPLIAPLILTLGEPPVHFTLDAWVTIGFVKGEVAAIANPPWNFWSGQQTPLRIWTALRVALQQQLTQFDSRRFEDLFSQLVTLSGRFGFDPGAAWNALNVGFSPNEHGIEVASSPAAELLACVGLQRFRPKLSGDRLTFYYATWEQPLPPVVAAVAAFGLLATPRTTRFRGHVVSRGSYAALGYSTPLKGGME